MLGEASREMSGTRRKVPEGITPATPVCQEGRASKMLTPPPPADEAVAGGVVVPDLLGDVGFGGADDVGAAGGGPVGGVGGGDVGGGELGAADGR